MSRLADFASLAYLTILSLTTGGLFIYFWVLILSAPVHPYAG